MASSLALRRLLTKSLSASTLRPISAAPPSASRLFNTNALRSSDDSDDESAFQVVHRRCGTPLSRRSDEFFPDVFGPFSPRRSLTDVLNLMDQISENPFLSAARGVGAGVRRGWAARETADALHLRLDMPGLGKEDVKVSVEHNTLSIKGEGGKDGDGGDGEGEEPRRYSAAIGLPEKLFKTDGVKAEMKNGVLNVVVPKIKEEERADVFQVKVE